LTAINGGNSSEIMRSGVIGVIADTVAGVVDEVPGF
jgi:hypothetical protein